MTEIDLAKKFVEYLSCYDLYFEVGSLSGCVDIVAKSGSILIAYEVKTSLNFEVIEQAARNTHNFHYSYICVPRPKRGVGFQREVCQKFGVGILTWDRYGHIHEELPPVFNRKAWVKHVRLHDYQKQSVPGTSSGGRITPFSITVGNMVEYVKRHQGCSIREMMTNISHHYHSDSGAISSTYQWLRRGVITQVKLENGKLYLPDERGGKS